MIRKTSVLTTLVDNSYCDQAKQLFSGVYWNAGWDGDCVLLAHGIEPANLQWFLDRGIIIHPCDTSFITGVPSMHPRLMFSKFELFTPFFKQWETVVYLDSDIIVRSSIDRLKNVSGLSAVRDSSNLGMQFVDTADGSSYPVIRKRIHRIQKRFGHFNLNSTGFNAGVMAFNTRQIGDGVFHRLHQLLDTYGSHAYKADQAILNLLFYRSWNPLPTVYNLYLEDLMTRTGINPENLKGIILHFMTGKPWERKARFHDEWQRNRDKADNLDFKTPPPTAHAWSKGEILFHSTYLALRKKLQAIGAL